MSEALAYEEAGFRGEPIINDTEAEEAIKAYREAEEQIAIMEAWYEHQLKTIKDQQGAIMKNEKARLQEYFSRVPHHKTKTTESYTLPHGKLVFKALQPDYRRNEEELTRWATEAGHDQYLKTSVSFRWNELKKNLVELDDKVIDAATGEVVPGVSIIDRGWDFSIGK